MRLNPNDLIRSQVVALAHATRAGNDQPLDLEALVCRLGISLRYDDSGAVKDGSLRVGSSGAIILLGGRPRPLSNRDRFTVAHEVGHFVLSPILPGVPLDKAEYWRREHLCNEFASHLLMPDEWLRCRTNPPPTTASGLLDLTEELVRGASVSFEAVVRRLVAVLTNVSFWEVDLRPKGARGGAILSWCHESVPFIDAGAGTRLTPEDPLLLLDRSSDGISCIVGNSPRLVPVAIWQSGDRRRCAVVVPEGVSPIRDAPRITLSCYEREYVLHLKHESGSSPARRIAEILELSADGRTDRQVAEQLKTSLDSVRRWKQRFAATGLRGVFGTSTTAASIRLSDDE